MSTSRDLRTPFLIFAIMIVTAAVALEIGSSWFLSAPQATASKDVSGQLGIPSLWLIDVILLWQLVYGGIESVGSQAWKKSWAQAQGVVTLVLSIVIILLGLKTLLMAFVLLMIMIALLSSFFGWLVYLPLFGLFDTGAAATVLGTITFFKLVAVVLLVLAQQRYLAAKGQITLFALSLVCDLLLSFLQSLPPGILVSVTDAIGAIVICIVAIIYAVVQAVYAIEAIVLGVRVSH